MKTYYIFRHGETFATLKGRGYGLRRLSAGILDSAKPTIIRMADYLKNVPTDYNVTSPVLRCRQTAEIITLEAGKPFVVDWRITEMMEPFEVLYWRLNRFIKDMERSKHQKILICTHGAVIEGLIAFLTKGSFKARDVMVNSPPTGVLIKIENGKIEEFDFNLK